MYSMTQSAIATFLIHTEIIKVAIVLKGVTLITNQRLQILEEVEKLLVILVKEKQLAGDSINKPSICEKTLHNNLQKETPGTSTSDTSH